MCANLKLTTKIAVVVLLSLAWLAAPAWADPLGAGDGTIYVMQPKSTYQEGCFPPCLCPILMEQPVEGTFKLRYTGMDNAGIHTYAVENISWLIATLERRVAGAGKLRIGSPSPITLLQQRMELDLAIGEDPPQHFDSGWVPIGDLTGVHVTISMNNMYCFDRVFAINARAASPSQISPYLLSEGATYQHGCWDPCDCLLEEPRPLRGDFGLLPLSDNGLFRQFAVLNVNWQVVSPAFNQTIPIQGSGFYWVGGEFAVQHRMALELRVGSAGPVHFDSGWVPGGGQFPNIDTLVSIHGMVCLDTVLHVLAEPAVGNVICGGIAGLPCPEGFFCKLPEGECCCDFMGMCAPIPTGCPDVWDPVCGCDGNTYGNECDADAAGVSIAHRGPCQASCGDNAPCGADEFCKFPIGVCDPTSSGGRCAPIPQACITIWDPVCGCDGQTYSNECEADRAGAMIAHRGECGQTCNDPAGDVCGDHEFCKQPIGVCDATAPGVCTMIPQVCPEYYSPVCGCDGVTYGNECEADAAAVSLRHRGECASGPCAASRDLSDPEPSYCPGTPKTVRIALTPPNSTVVLGVEDAPQLGWIVTHNISNGGVYDAVNHKVKWGPLFAPFPSELTYEVIPQDVTNFSACFSGAVSIDGVNQPICGDACITLFCCPMLPADLPQQPCAVCPVGDCNSCDAGSCADGTISLCEVIGYACAWTRGCNDDLAGMTRAAFIWRSGECYCWDEAQQKWVPTACSDADAKCCSSAVAGLPGTPPPVLAESALVEGGLKPARHAIQVPITVRPPLGTSAVALEIQVPGGWTPASISHNGQWDDAHRKVKWGPFFGDAGLTVSVDLQRASGKRRSLHGLSGTVSFDGNNQAITID